MDAENARVFGVKPWFPWPLSRWRWLNDPVRAEAEEAGTLGGHEHRSWEREQIGTASR